MNRRIALVALASTLLSCAEASGHGVEGGPGYAATISTVEPVVPGLLARVLDRDELSVRNWSGKPVLIADEDGRRLFRFAGNAVHRWDGARWTLVKHGTSHRWHDTRLEPTGPRPERSGLVSEFVIPGTVDGERFEISGFIGYRAGNEGRAGASRRSTLIGLAVLTGAVVLALILPLLVRREDEGASRETSTE